MWNQNKRKIDVIVSVSYRIVIYVELRAEYSVSRVHDLKPTTKVIQESQNIWKKRIFEKKRKQRGWKKINK